MAVSSAAGDQLGPTHPSDRTFTTVDFLALWAGIVVNVPSFYLSTSLLSLGLTPSQALLSILAGDLLLVPVLLLSGRPGCRLGLPFPALLPPAFGRAGAAVPALLRAATAAGWSAVESWILARAALLLLPFPASLRTSPPLPLIAASLPELLLFLLAVAAQLAVLRSGVRAIKLLASYASLLLAAMTAALLGWAYAKAGGFGTLMAEHRSLPPARLWPVFLAGVTASLSSWATLALNISDFTRFAKAGTSLALGHLGLPVFMGMYAFAGMAVASATEVIFGRVIANPVDLLAAIDMPAWLGILAFAGIALATVTTNIPANFIAPANVLVGLCPSRFTFARGAAATALASILFQPWRLLSSSESFVYTWLVGSSTVLGPVTGIFLADYYLVRQTVIDVDGLFAAGPSGPYYYTGGFNVPAFLALALSILPMIPGFLQKAGAVRSTSSAFAAIYDNAWFWGFFSAGIIYWALSVCRRGGGGCDRDSILTERLHLESA